MINVTNLNILSALRAEKGSSKNKNRKSIRDFTHIIGD